MSQDYVWPSSSDLEIDARRLHATPHSNHGDDLGLASALRRFPQAFDVTAVLICAVLVIPQIMTPFLPPLAAIVVAFGVCAFAPLLSLAPIPVFDLLRRRHGRGVAFTAARVILGGATAAIAFLPDVRQTGAIALVLLVVCRLVQGVAMRGLSIQSAETLVRPSSLSWRPSPAQWGDFAGVVVASLVFGALYLVLQPADFLQWGWRYPFVMAIAINIAGLFADLRVLATPRVAAEPAPRVRLATLHGVALD